MNPIIHQKGWIKRVRMNTKTGLWRGTFLCARFTFRQQWKVKANVLSFIMLCLISAFLPIISNIGNDYEVKGSSLEKVLFVDMTGYCKPELDTLFKDHEYYSEVAFTNVTEEGVPVSAGTLANMIETLEPTEILLTLSENEDGPQLTVSKSTDTEVYDSEVNAVCNALRSEIRYAYLTHKGVSDELAKKLTKYTANESFTQEEYENPGDDISGIGDILDKISEDEEDSRDTFALQFPFSAAMMMICILSASYILREVVVEKSSKLVDTILVGMMPESLLCGKILGVLLYVISTCLGIGLVFVATDPVREYFTGTSSIKSALDSLGDQMVNAGVLVVIVLFITMLLGIFLFSLLAGLLGAGCSSEEDTSSALGLPMILIMTAYMGSAMFGSFASGGLLKGLCLVPLLSSFLVPVQYITGGIGIGIVIASWLIQFTVIALLVWLCGSLYSTLLIYRGKRLGIGGILGLAFPKNKKSKRKEAE